MSSNTKSDRGHVIKRLNKGQTFFFSTLFLLCGIIIYLEPNIRGSHGYNTVNTLGRLLSVLMIIIAALVGLPRKINIVDILGCEKFLFLTTVGIMLSSLIGLFFGRCYGIMSVDIISDVFLRGMELIYFSIGAVVFIKRYKIQDFYCSLKSETS